MTPNADALPQALHTLSLDADQPTQVDNPYLASKLHAILRLLDSSNNGTSSAIADLSDRLARIETKIDAMTSNETGQEATGIAATVIEYVDEAVVTAIHRDVMPALVTINGNIDDWHKECGGLIQQVHVDLLRSLRDLWIRAEAAIRRNPNAPAKLLFKGLPVWSDSTPLDNLQRIREIAGKYFPAHNPLCPPPAANEPKTTDETVFVFGSFSEMLFFMGRWYYRAACLGVMEVSPVFD